MPFFVIFSISGHGEASHIATELHGAPTRHAIRAHIKSVASYTKQVNPFLDVRFCAIVDASDVLEWAERKNAKVIMPSP